MRVLRTVTTSWALWLEWGRLGCIHYFGNKTSYTAGTRKIKRWKITLRCIEVTLVLQAFNLRILRVTVTTFFHDLATGYLKGKKKSYSTDLGYTLNTSTEFR